MTKKLEELLNLPDAKEIVDEAKAEDKKTKKETAIVEIAETQRDIEELDKIASALPAVKGLGEMADKELNDIADRALTAYEDLMDLGMNVESRYSGRVFEVAGSMLKTGLDAKVAKMDKKLKMIELQLKKEKMDKDNKPGGDGMIEGEGYVVTDRNSLLERLKGLDKDK
jgi:chemotaxis protein histidine kinase CheA